MGKKGRWLSAVKRVFSCESNENRRKHKRSIGLASSSSDNAAPNHSPREEVKLIDAELEQNRHAYSVAIATAAAAEAAAAAANAAAEVVRLTSAARHLGKSKEEIAAIKIQTAFRGYLARRALRALRGLVRLKSLVGGPSVKRQAASTLKYMQTLAHVQTEIRARRLRMSERNSAITRQIQQKREKELGKSRASVKEDWDDSIQSKEQIEASLQHKQEAAMRRERALAYAYTHQQTWRNEPTSTNQTTFMDPNNLHWGWSWLERWMAAARPSEIGPTTKEPNSDRISINSTTTSHRPASPRANSGKTQQNSRPPSRQSPSTPKSTRPTTKLRPASPIGPSHSAREDESNSINSVQSEICQRRHSIAGDSSVRDDESLASSPAIVQGYMASTESARARARMASPLGSAKKRLSFSGSPGGPPRRHSGPPKVDISSMQDISAE
ncbi:IQ-domain 3 [Striga hermonthica]|uniref:IQ-domain 3 n=1 Tax=Striga hermonthica TaxID=68872 RepID=A0A9N7MUE6_STRHE|nr:IQ-domain 3 [Striga hermonthica]